MFLNFPELFRVIAVALVAVMVTDYLFKRGWQGTKYYATVLVIMVVLLLGSYVLRGIVSLLLKQRG